MATALGVQWDSGRDEACISCPQIMDLQLTPMRNGDEEDLVRLYNIPVIGERAYSRPYPFPLAEAVQLVADQVSASASILPVIRSALLSDSHPSIHILAFPWKCIRDSSGRVIGTISLDPFEHDERGLTVDHMLELPPADQVWLLGYVLHPAYQGRGVMTAFLNQVLGEWVKKWMGVGTIAAGIETDNPASEAVAKKLGFHRAALFTIPWPSGGSKEIGHFLKSM